MAGRHDVTLPCGKNDLSIMINIVKSVRSTATTSYYRFRDFNSFEMTAIHE